MTTASTNALRHVIFVEESLAWGGTEQSAVYLPPVWLTTVLT